MLHLGHLRSDQLGRVLLLAAVSLPLLPLLHLLVVVLHMEADTTHTHTHNSFHAEKDGVTANANRCVRFTVFYASLR